VSAGNLDDLYAFDPATMTWTNLSAADDAGRPSARFGHGFTSAGGLLYVHGGYGITGSGDDGEGMTSQAEVFNKESVQTENVRNLKKCLFQSLDTTKYLFCCLM
jgi:hypothetical protein